MERKRNNRLRWRMWLILENLIRDKEKRRKRKPSGASEFFSQCHK
jgi:hypothetical protein